MNNRKIRYILQVITCLLENGANIDALSNTKDTALHIMLKEDRRDCVNALLTSGADVSIPNHESETPLHLAIPVGNYGPQTSTYNIQLR